MRTTRGRTIRRYAKALFDLCEPHQLEDRQNALGEFDQMLNDCPELVQALTNPGIPIEQRIAVVRELAARMRSEDHELANFLALLVTNNRVLAVGAIAEVFGEMVDRLKQILSLHITSASPLSDEERGHYEHRLAEEFGGMISAQWEVDPEIIGGLLIRTGDKLLDGSVRGSLEQMRQRLLG